MRQGASFVPMRGCRLGMLAAAVWLVAASVPGESLARNRARAEHAQRARLQPPRAAVTVSVGASGGDARARELLTSTMAAWIARQPGLQFQSDRASRAALVLTANVRTLVVQRDAVGTLARCDLGVVVSDRQGAVRGMLDARRTVRSGPDTREDELAATVMRSAVDGAMRGLLAEVVPSVVP